MKKSDEVKTLIDEIVKVLLNDNRLSREDIRQIIKQMAKEIRK